MHRKLHTLWKSLFATRHDRLNPLRLSSRLQLQPLEDRLALTTLPAGFTETLVTTGSNLSAPTAMEFSPTGELWVLEQSGDVELVRGDGTTHEAIDLVVNSTGERGLLGLTFDSNYDGTGPNTDFIYLYYTEPAGPSGDPANNRLSRFTVTGAGTNTPSLGSEVILRDLPPETEDGDTNHNGGAIHFGPDGKLYVAVGDHNFDSVTQANHVSQILTTPFGKMLRLNADGTNPDDNPFYTGSASDWEGAIWALGLRNPFTFSFDPDSGRMFINDVGEFSWEEINEGEAEANFGWAGSPAPVWEGFENPPPPWANYRDPVMAYDHSNFDGAPAAVAITGGVFYPPNSQFGADFAGLYFFADFGANFIRTFDPDNPGQSIDPGATEGDEDTSSGFATNPTTSGPVDLKVDAAGNLYYLARGGPGEIYRVSYTGAYGPSTVEARQIFYNNSDFDNNETAANAADDGAIATDKTAYLPGGGTITPVSMTAYSRGINGIMVDVSGNHGPLAADDFTFRVSETGLDTNNTPSTWAAAPAPAEVLVRAGAGVGGSDRVEIVWADGAITDAYLEVTVEGNDAAGGFNTNTGLAASDIFYFGNRVGDDFLATPPSTFNTTAGDEIDARNNPGFLQPLTNIYDYNKDSLVSAADQIIARNDAGFQLKIDISNPPAAPGADPSIAGGDGAASAVASALTIPGRSSRPVAAAPRGTPPPGDATNGDSAARHVAPLEQPELRGSQALSEALGQLSDDLDLDQDLLEQLAGGNVRIRTLRD